MSKNNSKKYISKSHLTSNLKTILKKNGLNFSERERFFLVSMFDQNKKGELNLQEVSNVMFKENIESYFSRKDKRPKGPFFEISLKDLQLTKQQKQQLKRNKTHDQRKIAKEYSVLERCRVKLQKKLLSKTRNHLEQWNNFDVNKDGYIGLKDIKNKLLQMGVFSGEEMTYLLNHFSKRV